ncbi:cobaltochelatase subunit CobN [Aliikangiella sp. IMCC44359]|uniref:cobaltochelatase subunit CobN n=1 Tax=Aliikangiella sp. IMCC44359 TaxID=3459125 RepID=UPI00403A9B38
MSFFRNKIFLFSLFLVLVICIVAVYIYQQKISKTQVALVNYRDFQIARMMTANDSDWVQLTKLNKSTIDEFENYDVIMLFGRGLSLDAEQITALNKASKNGVKLIVESATNPKVDVTNIEFEQLEVIKDYLKYGGKFNYQQLFRYIRIELDKKLFGIDKFKAAKVINNDVLFHLDEDQLFTQVSDYIQYYQTLKQYNSKGKKIALLTSVPGPFNANRDHLDSLINQLETKGMQVYPIASFQRRLEIVKQIQPDAVIMLPHGRMHLGSGQQTISWLKKQNIPLFAPVSVFENYERWLDNPQGYSSNLLTMNVVLPELDGAIVPYAINAQFSDLNGYQVFKSIPQRLTAFTDLLAQWFELKETPNANKKLAIVYFKGPGKNALVAGNMEVVPSLFNTLHRLKKQGYHLGDLPTDIEQFKSALNRQGNVMVPYAKGLMEKFFKTADPALIPAEQYTNWCQTVLVNDLCNRISQIFGQPPGDFMVLEKQGKKQIAVARLQYGNVALLPQPLPGLGKDTFKLVHGTEKAPPHSYVAPYMWIREIFKADAIMHYGTHGSLEFTPGKQVALSSYDWADALIGNLPHFYVYTMSNVGEAIIAKRRTYATILSHLTPPFQEAGLYSELKSLDNLVAQYSLTQGSVQQNIQKEINLLIERLELQQDLNLTPEILNANQKQWQAQVLVPVSKWLETLAQSKITQGLYSLGKPYSEQQAKQTAGLMAIDALIQSFSEIEKLQNADKTTTTPQQLRQQAKQWIARRLQGVSSEVLLSELIKPEIKKRVDEWLTANPTISNSDMIKGFIALSKKSKKIKTTQLTQSELMALTAKVMSDEDSRKFLQGLDNEQSFAHVSKALDPATAEKAGLLAKVIPAIGRALKELKKPEVKQLVTAMQEKSVREKVMLWLSNDNLSNQVAEQKALRLKQLQKQLLIELPEVMRQLSLSHHHWKLLTKKLKLLEDTLESIQREPELVVALEETLTNEYKMTSSQLTETLSAQIKQTSTALAASRLEEQQLAAAVMLFQQTLTQIDRFKTYLQDGPQHEFTAITNGLDGGYVEPSSGGDPILNPSALPTGRNLFSIDAEKTPSVAAWKTGKEMADTLLKQHLQEKGQYPQKVSFTLWPSEFIHTQGATVAEALYLLGVEPVRDPFGRVQTLKLIPLSQLGRPRIDVVIQSAGQLRDLAASRLALIEKAVVMAAKADENNQDNFVAKGVKDAEQYLLAQGVAPLTARTNAYRRSFGGLNGAYGTAIMSQVEKGDVWQERSDIAKQYLTNMGAVYGDSESWGDYQPHLFAAALQNAEIVIHPRSGNTWGALSLDHVYEFMGGLNIAVEHVTGNAPSAYFNDFRNANKAKLQTLNEAVWGEVRTTLLNPAFIKQMTLGGASSAESFAETFRNTFGWNVMKPEAIDDSVWDQLYEVYIEDKNQLNMRAFFERENPYALQEMTGVMLETARKGLWQATEKQLIEIADLHAEMVSEFEAGCGSFTCGNKKLQAFIQDKISANTQLAQSYQKAIEVAQNTSDTTSGVVLKKQQKTAQQKQQKKPTDESTKSDEKIANSDVSPADNNGLWWFILLLVPIVFLVFRRK